jgi:hypothetical protein
MVRCPKSNRSWKWQAEGLSLVDRPRTTEAQRVNIFEINAVRKHLSRVAGSWLASPGDFGASRQSRINVFGVKARRKTPPEFDMHFLRLYNTGEHRLIGGPMSTKISPRWCCWWSSFWWWFISGSALMRPQTYNRLLDSLLAYDLDERVQT